MAFCVPHRLPDGASATEQRIFELLRQELPAQSIVYHEASVHRRHPAFVVIDPCQGLLVVEIKPWLAQDLVVGDAQSVTVRDRRGQPVRCLHPLRRAREYAEGLRKGCDENAWARHLLQREGPNAGQFCFPIGCVAVMANATRAQLRAAAGNGGWDAVFPPGKVIARDELEGAFAGRPGNGLRHLFEGEWPFPAMTAFDVRALRAVMHPEARLADAPTPAQGGKDVPGEHGRPGPLQTDVGTLTADGRPARAPLARPASLGAGAATVETVEVEVVGTAGATWKPSTVPLEARVLDLHQERAARRLNVGHHLVFGAVGSGKTSVLISRARLLARTGRRVLVLCFNASLARLLEGATGATGGSVTVRDLEAFAAEHGVRRRPMPPETQGSMARRLLARWQKWPPRDRFDAVLIDEAQDFDVVWFRCARQLLADPQGGDLLIVGDGNQGTQGRVASAWSSLGFTAHGHTTILRRPYRSTQEILEFAAPFATETPGEDDGVRAVRASPESAVKFGSRPVVQRCRDRADECDRALDTVTGWLRGRFDDTRLPEPLRPADVAVVVPAVTEGLSEVFALFRGDLHAKGIPSIWISDRRDPDARGRTADPGVKLLNVFHAKGLQFRAVVFLWADLLPRPGWLGRSGEEQQALFYTALTRAEEFLTVLHSGDSPFVARLGVGK